LLLHGDAEADLLAAGEAALQSIAADREVDLVRAWATRPDWLDPAAAAPPAVLRRGGVLPDVDPRELLAQPHSLVILALLPALTVPALRHRAGGVFLAHSGVRAGWSPEMAAAVAADCVEEAPLSAPAAAMALLPVIEGLQARGTAVAVCKSFRHVRAPMEHRGRDGVPALRETVRRMNLEVARLSRQSGCFVLDFDRPFAQEGGASLDADCFGGNGRAAELALEEFAALIFDALPDLVMPMETP
jgi:hypothetical protein